MTPYIKINTKTIKTTNIINTQISIYQTITINNIKKNIIKNILLIIKPHFIIQF